jgi:radical SAM protein with 4Fe4S-binding SPASM domain
MLHPEFDRLAHILREYFPDAFLIVFTNLQYDLQKVKLREILPLLNMLGISIDGIGATYEKLRLGASFPRVLHTLNSLGQTASSDILGEKVFINFTATEENYRELPKIYNLKEKYGLAGVRINLAQNWDIGQHNTNMFSDEMIEALQAYKEDVKGVGGWEYKDCFWPFRGVAIDVFGNVRQCVLTTTQQPLGNLFQQPLREIFNRSETLMRARAQLEKNCAPTTCSTCDYFHLSSTLTKIHGQPHFNKPYPKTAAAYP